MVKVSQHLRIISLQTKHPSRCEWQVEAHVARLGVPYRAQFPCGKYAIDLALPQYLIAIEIQDKSHNTKVGREKDAVKHAWLRDLGWSVLAIDEHELADDFYLPELLSTLLRERTPGMVANPLEFRQDYYARKAKERTAKKARKDARAAKASSNEVKPPRARRKAKVGGGEKEAPRSTKKAA